jgi:hypothetical protein
LSFILTILDQNVIGSAARINTKKTKIKNKKQNFDGLDCIMNFSIWFQSMIGENRQLGTDEPVEIQDCRKITDHFREIYRIYPTLINKIQRMSTCDRLDLQTLGSQPISMPKTLPTHWF